MGGRISQRRKFLCACEQYTFLAKCTDNRPPNVITAIVVSFTTYVKYSAHLILSTGHTVPVKLCGTLFLLILLVPV